MTSRFPGAGKPLTGTKGLNTGAERPGLTAGWGTPCGIPCGHPRCRRAEAASHAAVSCQLSAVSCRLSAVSCRLSACR
ncbi:hypothetical protein F7R91_02710 [Streptomyces luteolifulvus]|uniref:Uncharacterized protein n=1 Tax=Streptomyces luteolifulvus TaxID=2615112 RepID=A0A6H9V3Z3_9ACTN|nr:hypothetical protein F7R91_02710 [Streptomyces luteolifulvus]